MTRPAQSPADAPRTLPRDTGPVRLYAGAVRHLAGRVARWCASRLLRAADRIDPRLTPTAVAHLSAATLAARAASKARHPSTFPVHDAPGLVLTLNRRPTGHGASEGDPDL